MIYHTLYEYVTNPDSENNFFLQNNFLAPGIIIAYILFTTVLGRIIMENKKPMDLKYAIIVFNGALVAANAYFCVVGWPPFLQIWPERCNFTQSAYYKIHYREYEALIFQCLLAKFAELLDTVFFVLRKKYNQISFLHVFHHFSVAFSFWVLVKTKNIEYYVVLLGMLNAAVHVMMYTYYFLSAFGPRMQKYLWWKKYMTTIQIVQFIIVISYTVYSILTGCDKFSFFGNFFISGVSLVMILFLRFYIQTYSKTRKVK